jgi:hypothetical protein
MKVKDMKYHSMGSKDYVDGFAKSLKLDGFKTKIIRNKGNLFALYYYKEVEVGQFLPYITIK